jgi:hypothetical protein
MAKKATTYWVWESYPPVRGSGGATDIAGLEPEVHAKLVKGERLAQAPKLTVRETASGRPRDELGSYIGIPLVSPAIREVLEKTPGAHLQFIPVRLTGKSDAKYFAVNVLDSYPAIDLEQSRYDRHEGTTVISRMKKLVPRDIPAGAPPIFHAAEHPVLVLVNKDVHDRLVAAVKYPGVLTPAQQYKNVY